MQRSCWDSSKDQTSRTGPSAGPIGWFESSQQEGQQQTSIIGRKSPEASRSRFKIREPGKGLKINSDTSHLSQMRWTPSSPNSSRWRPKQPTILTCNQRCRSMRPSFHSRWWTTSTRWSDQWTSKDGRKLPANTIRTTQRSRTFGVYSKKPQRRPLRREASQGSRRNCWRGSWESRCRLQTRMRWTRALIGPDPIVMGKRRSADERPAQKKNPRIGARRWNVSIATRKAIFSVSAPTRTRAIKERSQSKPGGPTLTPKTPKKNTRKEVFWKNLLPEQKTFLRR